MGKGTRQRRLEAVAVWRVWFIFFPQEAINHAPEKACSRRIAMMNLYEIINSDMGESYVRVYVWAEDEEQAYSLARAKFNEKGYKISTPLSIKFLFSQDEKPFSTIPSDTGFVCETTSK
jgi:hypothetical protein